MPQRRLYKDYTTGRLGSERPISLTLKISGGHTYCSLFKDDWTRPLNLDVGVPELKGYSNEWQLMYKHLQE